MKRTLIIAVGCIALGSCSSNSETKPFEFADAKYTEVGKRGLQMFAKGDIDGFTNDLAENAVFIWNNGDSIAGKQKITEYWRDRRSRVIKSFTFSDDVWLPLKVNRSQTKYDAPGVWLMVWFRADGTYSNSKSVKLSIHILYHFDANDKIDRVVEYLDRAPINAALAERSK